jgi:RNA-directed DNA polymerase
MGLFDNFLSWLTGKPSPTAEPARTADDIPISRSLSLDVSHGSPAMQSGKLDLDAGDFLPIGRTELKEQAQAEGRPLWSNPWFGRRDLIPPADDVRTKLIDRALVTHGFLSPDELVEIHQVGALMQELRPALELIQHQAAQAGDAAVEADREQKRAIKEQKKKEAAERRQQRAERIAHRKATDILFLGRGVSGRLHQRTSDAKRLAELGLPLISTPAELATALGLEVPQLRWLAFHSEVAARIHYVTFTVPKRSGGLRTLSTPHRKLAAAQQWIHENILKKLSVETPAHGFVAGKSVLSNAKPHIGKKVLVNADLENFFPSITFPRMRSVIHRLGYSPAVATILALLCTECPRRQVMYDGKPYWVATGPRGLPQGACTSPALSNQVARRLDKRFAGLAAKMELTYTRYADDLTFSGDAELDGKIGYFLARVRHIAEDEGFTINEKKTRVLGRRSRQQATGIVVNDKPSLPREELRRLRAILHRACKEGLDAQNRERRSDFRAWLQGKIAYVRMVRPELGERMLEQFRAAK